jgi:uncharacterized phage protein (TIGR01671 family)
MKREIKYQAFYRGKMYQVAEMSFYEDGSWGIERFIGENFSPDSEHITGVRQSTGLKDKNGKEIYEGDKINDNGCMGVVIYEAPAFMIKYDFEDYPQEFDDSYVSHIEVIGNIYENSELLKP